MIKSIDRRGNASVTFTLPATVRADRAAVCGEWNGWSPDRDVMERVTEGFSLTVSLRAGRAYRFRYLLDGHRWENDWDADAYWANGFGGEDSVVDLTALATLLPGPSVGAAADNTVSARTEILTIASAPTPAIGSAPTPAIGSAPTKAIASAPSPTSAGASVEREAKLVAPPGLTIPDLNGLVPGATATVLPVARLDATYYDTSDLRLARSGVTVRHRGGESGPAWTVKLPEDEGGSDMVRREIRFEGPPGRVPNPAADLVLASTRARALEPVASLTTVRRPVEIRGLHGELLAEVVDDTVSVSHNENPTGWFREVEVELHTGGSKGRHLLDAAVSRLIDAGCDAQPPIPKLVRALGEPATRPADVVVPPLPAAATVVDLVRHATARAVAQIIRYDPGARLGDDPEDVHKLRVATRRLRSDLHSFSELLARTPVRRIRVELGWLGGVVGAVRDTDVLSARFSARLAMQPEVDADGAARLRSLLESQAAEARAALLIALRDARYLRLLDALVSLAAAPPFKKAAKLGVHKSRAVASRIVQKPWQRVVDAVEALGPDPSDAQLHAVRILAKRSRYAAEAAAPLLEPSATRFAAAVADLQTVLGDHQDTVLAEAWLRSAFSRSTDVSPTVARLIELEQEQRASLRAQWPTAWRKATAKKLHTWT